MSGLEHLLVLVTGLGAGVISSTVGVASMLSFPVLVAIGLPPVVANASNTIGLAPAGLSGSFGYRAELRAHPRVAAAILTTCAVGSVAGAVLLLALPPGVFEAVVPWLILFTCLLVGATPTVNRWLRRHAEGVRDPHGPAPEGGRSRPLGPATTVFATLTGVYGGYFGAGAGVMMMAVLGLGTELELQVINALKTLSLFAANAVATVVFVLVADIAWSAAGLLAAGSVVGGYVGARIGRRLPAGLLRVLVVVAGVVAAVLLV